MARHVAGLASRHSMHFPAYVDGARLVICVVLVGTVGRGNSHFAVMCEPRHTVIARLGCG